MDENLKKKRTRVMIFACIALVIIFSAIQIGIKKRTPDNDVMTQAANEINTRCPMMVDSITRLDSSVALRNNVLQFNYTINNADKLNYDTAALQNTVRPLTLNALKSDPEYKVFRENDITLSFVYRDRNGSYLCSILMNANDIK